MLRQKWGGVLDGIPKGGAWPERGVRKEGEKGNAKSGGDQYTKSCGGKDWDRPRKRSYKIEKESR